MRVVVTGVAGFIGSTLLRKLLSDGHHVIGFDNFISGSRDNIADLLDHDHFDFYEQDVVKSVEVEGDVDVVVNLASPASPYDFDRYSLEILDVNSVGVENILELVREKGARLVHASTSEVYGDPLIHPQPETYFGNANSYGPRACYDESKRFSEALIYSYRKKFNINSGIIRIFNTYGPRMRFNDGRVMPNFIVQALQGDDLTVYGDGSQTRSFCFVDDMVDGIIKMMNSDFEGPVNIGNTAEYSVLELAEKVISLTGSSSKIVYKGLPQDDPMKRRPDLGLAERELGYRPQVAFEDGVNQTIEYFRKVLG